jgi:hypothetical protein
MSVSSGSSKVFGWFVNLVSLCFHCVTSCVDLPPDIRRWLDDLVRHWYYLCSILFGYEGTRLRSDQASVLPFLPTVRRLLCHFHDFLHLPGMLNPPVETGMLIGLQLSGFNLFLKGGWDTAGFITQYLSFLTFFLLYGVGKYLQPKPIVKAKDMDFQSGLAEIEADTYDEPPPNNKFERFWQWLVRFFFNRCASRTKLIGLAVVI